MKKLSILLILFVGLLASCSKSYLETMPTSSIPEDQVFQTATGSQTVIDGVLRQMRDLLPEQTNHDVFGVKAVDLSWDLMGEDIVCRKSHWFVYDYQLDNRAAAYRRTATTWRLYYVIINNMNKIIVNLPTMTYISAEEMANVEAQAYALRAFAYYELINIYQFTYLGHQTSPGVPLYTEPTLEGKPRASVQDVYTQIVSDLDHAITVFTDTPVERRDISSLDINVVHGLRARVALTMGEYAKAESEAVLARTGYNIDTPDEFAAGFSDAAASNWIWALAINDEQSTIYASLPSHLDMSIGGYAGLGYMPKYISTALYNQLPADDIRKLLCVKRTYSSVDYYINFKFNAALAGKDFAADYVMMRPEEMLLIQAEAIQRQNTTGTRDADVQGLLDELHAQRQTAPVAVTATGNALLQAVLLERRFELWGEGFRGKDIKRLKLALDRTGSNHPAALAYNMTLAAEADEWNYQIPQGEIDANDAIADTDQNP
jgi:hypothetical protein